MLNGVNPAGTRMEVLTEVFTSADMAIANLEIPLTNANTRTERKTAQEIAERRQYVLRADPRHAPHLAEIGLDAVSLANNHTMDFGPTGFRDTVELLEEHGMGWFGAGMNLAEAETPVILESRTGVRVAHVGFMAFVGEQANWKTWPATEDGPGVAALNFGGVIGERAQTRLRELADRLRVQADVLVVWPHWGIESQPIPRDYQVQLGQAFIDAGFDVVVGSHPHVLQGAVLYNGRPMLFSLGNLISSGGRPTAVAVLRFRGRQFEGLEWFPVRITGGGNLTLENNPPQAVANIDSLSDAAVRAFPNHGLSPLRSRAGLFASP